MFSSKFWYEQNYCINVSRHSYYKSKSGKSRYRHIQIIQMVQSDHSEVYFLKLDFLFFLVEKWVAKDVHYFLVRFFELCHPFFLIHHQNFLDSLSWLQDTDCIQVQGGVPLQEYLIFSLGFKCIKNSLIDYATERCSI